MNSCQNCPILKKSIFCSCSNDTFLKNEKLKKQKTFTKGQTIFNQNSNLEGIFCIKNGSVKIVKSDSKGNETIVRLVMPGDVIGEDILMGDKFIDKSAITVTDSEICYIDKPTFSQLIKSADVSLNLLKKTFNTLDKAESHICSCHRKKVIGRLAEFILDIKNHEGSKTNNTWKIDLNFSREELATIIGTAPETIIRSISSLKKMGIITSDYKTILIKDLLKLEKIANS